MKKLFIQILCVTFSILPLGAESANWSVFGDALVWHASEQEATTWASIISEPSNKTANFDAANVNFSWDLGFRGGLMYEPDHDARDLKLYWTNFTAKTSNNFALGEQIVAPEFFSGFISTNIFFGGGINWKLELNMLDFDIGHKLQIGKAVTLRPAIGIKGGTINQTVNCDWNAVLYTANEEILQKFWGVGPSFAIDSKWHIFENFSLIGNFATAFLWGNWNVVDTYKRPTALLVTPTTITTTMSNARLGTAMFDYFMGFEWAYKGRSSVTIQLGYEMQFWANQLRMTTFQILPVHGDLTLQGGTCHIRIDL